MPGEVGELQRSQQKFIVFEDFEKLNTQSLRQALPETEIAWLENLQPIAGNNLTTVPAPGTSIANIVETFTSFFYASISGTDYIIGFTSAGAGFAVNVATGVVNNFAPDGTFSSSPDVTPWQAQRILIADTMSGYATWDGTLFVQQGGVSPVFIITSGGSGYSSPPSVTISGGSGTGATATAVISGGVVIAIVLTNPGTGYKATDVLTVTFGTGVGSGATGHVTMTGFPVASISINDPGHVSVVPAGVSPVNGTFSLSFSGGGGSGAAGTATVINTGTIYTVSSVTLTSPGSGYTSAPSVTLTNNWSTGGRGGVSPVFTANLGTEQVASIVLDTGGSAYVSPPTVTISGGGASVPATAHATISGGAVNALILDTVGSVYTSTPTVIIGTGSGAAASAHVWPFVPKPATLAVFQGRVWLGGGALPQLLQWTGTGGFDDFSAADASGSLILSDADLIHAITALRNYNNYLFIMGDQSVKQIGNISLNNAGNVTLFTILTLSSDQGTIYPRSCVSFNRVFLFANSNGIYAVVGATVQKISDDLDGIFKLIDFSQSPNAAVADINNIHNVVFLVRYKDPLETTRSVMLAFSGKKWFVLDQGDSLACIVSTAKLSTGLVTLFGSSGTDVTPLLNNTAAAVEYRLQTSLTNAKNAIQRKKLIRGGFAASAGGSINVTMSVDTENGSQTYTVPLGAGFQSTGQTVDGAGRYAGMTLTGSAAGLTFINAALEYQEGALWG